MISSSVGGILDTSQVDGNLQLPTETGKGSETAFGIVQRLLKDTVRLAIELGGNGYEIDQELRKDFERWDILIPKFSTLLPAPCGVPGALKRRRIEETIMISTEERLQMRLEEDLVFAKRAQSNHTRIKAHALSTKPLDHHQKAFVQICNTIQRHQDLPSPSCFMTKLISNNSAFNLNEEEALKGCIAWVESTIQDRLAGWRSCVKLKIQFFAVFEDSSINEDFAELICQCDLQWELCNVLSRYLKRHRADATRLTFGTFQLGCELLLSVFSKKEQIRCQLRDHLYFISRSICEDIKAPLFGSWEFWMINIETQLIATLNQLVATKGSSKSSVVPPHTIEALTKISLIAPYQVIAKIVSNAMVNRGQSYILLEALVNLGQLPWLRASPEEKTLFVTVIHDVILMEDKSEEAISDQKNQHHNFVEFILKALVKVSQIGQALLDPTEFLEKCVNPLLSSIIDGAKSSYFSPVVAIMMKLYQPGFGASRIDEDWLFHGIHLTILAQLLHLRTVKCSPTLDQHFAGPLATSRQLFEKEQGIVSGDYLEDVSKFGELLVSRLSAYTNSMTTSGKDYCQKIDNFLQAVQNHGRSIDLESRLMSVPLLIAYRDHLHKNIKLPKLPKEMWPLCHNHLKSFSLSETENRHVQEEDLLKALLAVLDVGRMCDEVISDVVQAISQPQDLLLTEKGYLTQALIPALYRVLSISSRSEGHRLLVRGIPTLVKTWGSMKESSFFWDLTDKKPRKRLGPYWDDYTLCKYRTVEKEGESQQENLNGFTSEEVALTVLMISELLHRFALEPLAPESPDVVLQVYRTFIGYDMMVDHMTSLVFSSIKFTKVDWSAAPLDFVLFCFMTVCKLSNIVTNEHMDKPYKNRLYPATLDSLPPTATEGENWASDYSTFMSQQCDKNEQQELVARSKSRDELVLAAMNLSEEIVRRQDNFYKSGNGDVDTQERSLPEYSVAIGTGNETTASRGKGKKRKNRGGKRGQRGRGGREDRSVDQHDIYRDDDGVSSNTVSTDGMDEGTRAWFNSIMGASTGPTTRESPKPNDTSLLATSSNSTRIEQHQQSSTAPPTPEPILSNHDTNSPIPPTLTIEPSMPTELTHVGDNETFTPSTQASESPKQMLSPDQVDCLTLALDYLPEQEQLAVRSRLSRLLGADQNHSSAPVI
ncbi:hypothetical protein BGX27_004282 [Mortierella sp. AM989]|nr:hypothetical protein BGX27_004282 [Mortierella sp. AM989]